MTLLAEPAGTIGSASALERLLTVVRRHPLTRRLKPWVRDAVWTIKGAWIRNPPANRDVRSILFVCKGNICRSPFAAALCTRRLAETGRAGIRVSSAGIQATSDARPPQDACEVAACHGLSLEGHVPQLLTRELLLEHDLTVVMEGAQLWTLRRRFPDCAQRVILLSLFDADRTGGYARYNLSDPFGHPRAAYEACYDRIDGAVTGLLAAVVRAEGTGQC
jgi:protein-tyrosine phosphatase